MPVELVPGPNGPLLTRIDRKSDDVTRPMVAIVYLHGFPDQSVNHCSERGQFGEFASRFPRKLCELALKSFGDDLVFVSFNFSGSPGVQLVTAQLQLIAPQVHIARQTSATNEFPRSCRMRRL